MGTPVDANGRSILHKGHGKTHVCAPPDVCKTPSPGGPVPIPYPNIATDSNIADGAETVKIEGNPVATVSSKISTSSGDEAGSAGGGILSSKIKGTVTWKMGSLDVKAEGNSVVRYIDPAFHNGNSFNSAFKAEGGTGVAYADDFEGPCPICGKDSGEHKILEKKNSADLCAKIVKELKAKFEAADAKGKRLYAKNGTGGYMVGVMICKCEKPKSFAAMSGIGALDGFKTVATAAGVDVVLNTGSGPDGTAGALKPSDYARANTSGLDPTRIANRVGAAFRMAGIRKDGGNKQYSFPGICAGAHLLARSGHAPAQMTEMFFAPRRPWNNKYDWTVIIDGVTKLVGGKPTQSFTSNAAKADENPWGLTVASCKTCQDLLPLTMCPVRKCP
jgi:uncharacterized Zn-binding protein involved in type VI secretion